MLNISFEEFKKNHRKKQNQVIYYSINTIGISEIKNLIDNFLNEKNSFVFESVEKGIIKGRYTIFGKNPDKIWEFNNNNSFVKTSKKKIKIKGNPKKIIEKIIEDFQFKIPKELPPISSLISGYFSYDIIRYIENVPNNCKDDLKIPDTRILRPKTLVIHDNLKKKIYYIQNCFKDEKITNYEKKYKEIYDEIINLIFLSKYNLNVTQKNKKEKIKVKSNISKSKFIKNVNIAKKYIKIGDIFQVVLSQRFEAKLTKNPIEIYKKLRLSNPHLLCIFLILKIFK